jgi:hypothetical protein
LSVGVQPACRERIPNGITNHIALARREPESSARGGDTVRAFPTTRVLQQPFPRTRLQNRTFEQGYIRTGGDLWSPGVQMVRAFELQG